MTLRDIELNTVSPIAAETSLRRAWQAMRDENTTTLLVADDAGALAGMVTLKDISSALLDGLDTHVLEKTRTSYANVVDALDGAVLSGEAAEKRVEAARVASTVQHRYFPVVDEQGRCAGMLSHRNLLSHIK